MKKHKPQADQREGVNRRRPVAYQAPVQGSACLLAQIVGRIVCILPFALLLTVLAGLLVYGLHYKDDWTLLQPMQIIDDRSSGSQDIITPGQTAPAQAERLIGLQNAYMQAFLQSTDHDSLNESPDEPADVSHDRAETDITAQPSPEWAVADIDTFSHDLNRRRPDQTPYYILEETVCLLDLPDSDLSDVLAVLVQGDQVIRLSVNTAEWSKVMLQDGQVGYLMTAQITRQFVDRPTPTPLPTVQPTPSPSTAPVSTAKPTEKPKPTTAPTRAPTPQPTVPVTPTEKPQPTATPSPTAGPTAVPEPTPSPTPVPQPSPTPLPTAAAPGGSGMTTEQEQAVIELARSLIGTRYVFAGMSPSVGFDCSGFTSYVYKTLFDITLPRRSRDQANFGTAVSSSDIRIGDILCFDWQYNDGITDHVGLYIGAGKYIHASSSNRTYYSDSGAVIESTVVFGRSPVVSIRRIIP